jgi:hypothetical protein
MINKKTAPKVKSISKKEVDKEVHAKISGALSVYKNLFNPGDFEKKIKKAAKLFATGIRKKTKGEKKKAAIKKKQPVKK